MAVSGQKKLKKGKRYHIKLAVQIFILSFSLSILMSFASQTTLSKSSVIFAFFVLLVIIFIGVIFDIVGVAVATADPAPFHAMASKKNPKAILALVMLKRASLVATFSNDVIGDIAGIISGTAVAIIVFRMVSLGLVTQSSLFNVLLSSTAAGLTVGGKAIGKELAINHSKEIVYLVATVMYDIKYMASFKWLKKKHRG
ncbi:MULTISPECIES: hypothetical protein [unclassified Fusibacter]|uniref:hypothetical protein n=1 Tax=unclassified Fusibacter TaxID=2624464 RepID=UPI001013673E|nr:MULTISPECIES: hypothetical protein [unclassified Fusibacter]MCK8058881.1 hypothetical protein [Fusibacter sp. A2]NPE21956.1 hypothetical protein [Fusibacter sp. A1]RXV61524.1 hypothetical protein DWB64_08930 [Fusibacter sp. A1]